MRIPNGRKFEIPGFFQIDFDLNLTAKIVIGEELNF